MEKKTISRYGVAKKPHSPKVLPVKKSSALSGIRRELPRSSHLLQYQASQTRAQRGRLRDLRIRCVARKFLYLWIRMTFGRVFPSRARLYYEQRILQKVFGEWKEEWWVSQREWKLCVRADCHYRYYLYSLMFQNWKSFVRQQQEMRDKHIKAQDHDVKQKMRQAWKSWLIYVVIRRTKLHMQTTALEFRQRSVLGLWWSRWRWRLGQVRMGRTLHARAVKHHALSLQHQAWSWWQEQLLRGQQERQKAAFAVRHHQHWQKRRSLQAWLRYLHICRAKRQQNEMAVRFHRVTVLQLYFCDWQWAWEWRQSLSAHQALVTKLGKRMALRRVFIHWKHYVLLCAEEAAQREAAEEHRRHTLLYFCFRALKDNVAWAHLWRMRKNLACQQYDVTLLRRFWNLWQSCMEQREEREQLTSLHAAQNHYRVTLLCRCVRSWLQYTQERRRKQVWSALQQLLQARADGHFQRRAVPVAFHTWSRLCRWHQQERVLHTRAVCFHRETVEKQTFAIWWQKMFQHRENCLAERMAVLHAEQQLLRRFWFTWHRQAAAHHQDREWQAIACTHHHNGLLRKAFSVWWESTQGVRTERMGRSQAAHFLSARLLRWAWNRWREVELFVSVTQSKQMDDSSVPQKPPASEEMLTHFRECLTLRAEERQKLMRADLHRQHAVLHRALQKWLIYQDRVRGILREVAARESRHNTQRLRWVLHRWRDNTMARLEGARKNFQASAHYQRTLCSKVLVQWREVASVQIYYRQKEAAALREAQKVLDRGCLRNWFRRWKSYSQRATQQRAQLERAAWHHRHQLLLEGVAQWKAYHLGCIRKRLLKRQGAQLLAQRLSRACFCQWRQQLEARRQEQQATARALWFWALALQAKVWAAWMSFVLERRRKKARLERAVQAYHQQLQQEGVTRLLRFTADMKASRQQLQAQQQVQAAHSLHCAVRRCAELWKKKVLGPGRESQLPAPITSSRRVTFEGSLLSGVVAKAEDAVLEKKRLQAPRPQGAPGSLTLGAGEPELLELPEKPQEWDQGMAQSTGLSLLRPFVPGALTSAPGLKLPCTASSGPELLPPSSFMPRRAGAAARVSAKPTTPGPSALASGPDTHLFLPADFTSSGAGPRHGSEANSEPLGPPEQQAHGPPRPHSPIVALSGPREDSARDLDHTELEAELEGIHQQLQHYQTTKENLGSCQRQARSLRRWLELSQEEPRPEDQDVEQQVQKELEEVELQIQQLAMELRAQRQPIGACISRIQALRQALR